MEIVEEQRLEGVVPRTVSSSPKNFHNITNDKNGFFSAFNDSSEQSYHPPGLHLSLVRDP